jgi:hypothetical protein
VTGTVLVQPFKSAMPNDALYIARVISEQAQINATFNNNSRNKLTAKIANNHARDIASVFVDPEFEEDDEAVTKLNEDFKKEINTVKESLTKITNIKIEDDEAAEDKIVFAVDLEKDNSGLEIYNSDDENTDLEIIAEEDTEDLNLEPLEIKPVATTTEATSTVSDEAQKEADSYEALDEVQNLYDQSKYEEALEGLDKIDEMIDKKEVSVQGTLEDEIDSAS